MNWPEFQDYCNYLHPEGKIVLDVGAGDFDSARYFLERGKATKVICIEKFEYPIPEDLKGKLKVYVEQFDPEKHLNLEYDVAKFDIEGYEILLLPYLDKMKRTMAEVHSGYLVDKFREVGWRIFRINHQQREHCIQALMVNDCSSKYLDAWK